MRDAAGLNRAEQVVDAMLGQAADLLDRVLGVARDHHPRGLERLERRRAAG